MKTKYNGLVCFFIFALAGICLLIYGVTLSDKMAGSIRISRPASVSDIKVPDDSTMAYISFLTPKLSTIATTKDHSEKVALNIFGFSLNTLTKDRIKDTSYTETTSVNDIENRLSYVLTLSFTSPKSNFCMIDKKLYTENGILPDKGKILKIETGRVLVLKNKKKQWIYSSQQ